MEQISKEITDAKIAATKTATGLESRNATTLGNINSATTKLKQELKYYMDWKFAELVTSIPAAVTQTTERISSPL